MYPKLMVHTLARQTIAEQGEPCVIKGRNTVEQAVEKVFSEAVVLAAPENSQQPSAY